MNKTMRGKYTLDVLHEVRPGLLEVYLVEWCPDCGKRDEYTGNMRPSEVLDYRRLGAACCEACAATRDEIAYATGY